MSPSSPYRRRPSLQVLGLAAATLLVGAAACEPESESADTAVPVVTTAAPTTLPPVTAPPTSSTTTTVPVDLLGSCVEHAKFQAFTGNDFWASIWDDAGRTDDAMRATCRFLATDRPGWLEEIHARWLELQTLAGLAPTATSAP